jgi:dipeptidyl aminopeptidase/acylaminoacyl peptidase
MTAPTAARSLARIPRLTRFDQLVIGVIGLLLGITALTITIGDHVGARVVRFGPTDTMRATSPITIQFSEDMDRASVASHFRLEPGVAGDFTWSGRTMMFRPAEPLAFGVAYTAVLDAGAESAGGRKLLAGQRFSLSVRGARVAYLAPVDGPVKNVWLADPTGGSRPEQLTHSSIGISAFDASPDGARIVVAERNGQGIGVDLRLIDLDTGENRLLTSCADVACTNPVWSPDGTRVAFERMGSIPSVIPGVAAYSTRVWVLDPSARQPRVTPLIPDAQVPSHNKPRWSPDGTRIAVSELVAPDNRDPGVLIYDLASAELQFSRTTFASVGVFSPDGARFVYPKRIAEAGKVRTIVESLDIGADTAQVVSPPDAQVDQGQLGWTGDGRSLVLARRIVDDEPTLGRQLYTLDQATAALAPLLVDPGYDHAFFLTEPKGQRYVIERSLVRVPEGSGQDSKSQIWTLDPATGALIQVATNAFYPRWVP